MQTHWMATADRDPFPALPELPGEADAVVIGGGLVGAATAYWLARAGWAVLLAEACRLAAGASGRNAGVYLAGLHPTEQTGLVRSVLAEEDIDAGLRRSGHLALSSSAGVLEQVRAEVARRPAGAPPLHVLDRPACEELLRMRIGPGFAGGRWAPDGHVVHPVRLVQGIAAAAVRRGALVATATRVTRVVPGRRRALRVHTVRGPVDATHVVYACGAAAAHLQPALAPVLTATRGQVLATGPLPPLFGPAMAVDYGDVYWRQDDDGTIVLGGCRAADPGTERDATREELNPAVQQVLEAFLPGAFPGFPRFRIRRRWAGIMDRPADGRPLIGAVPRAAGHWVAAGFGGHGLPGGVGAGRALAESMTTGRPSTLLESFDPARFPGAPDDR